MMHIVTLLHVVTLQLLVLMYNELLVLIKLWQEWVRFEHKMVLEQKTR